MTSEPSQTGPSDPADATSIDADTLQRLWDIQFKLGISRAQNAMNLCLHTPNITTLSSVDLAASLLQSMQPQAECLAQAGKPSAMAQLTACVQDLCKARNTLAQTYGLLAAADRLDSARLRAANSLTPATQRNIVTQRNTSANNQANEVRKLL